MLFSFIRFQSAESNKQLNQNILFFKENIYIIFIYLYFINGIYIFFNDHVSFKIIESHNKKKMKLQDFIIFNGFTMLSSHFVVLFCYSID